MSHKTIKDVIALTDAEQAEAVNKIAEAALNHAKVSCSGLSGHYKQLAVAQAGVDMQRAIMRYEGEVATNEPATDTNLTKMAIDSVRQSCKNTKSSQAK